MARRRHPKKEIESQLRLAEAAGWTVFPTKAGHAWGEMRCGALPPGACRVAVWSTPRDAGNHAKALGARIKKCPHATERT